MAWNRPSEVKAQPKKTGSGKLIAYVSLGAIAIGVCVALFCLTDKPARRAEKSNKSKTIQSAIPAKVKLATNAVHKTFVKTGNEKLDAALTKLESVDLPSINRPKLPPVPDHYTNHWFKSGTEQIMSWVFTTELGTPPMPIPKLSDKERQELVSVLIGKSEISEDDDEMTQYAKEAVNAAKKEMMQFIKDGGDPDDFLAFYYNQLELAWQYREQARVQGFDLTEEDPELGQQFLAKINESLRERGIRELTNRDFGLEEQDEGHASNSQPETTQNH